MSAADYHRRARFPLSAVGLAMVSFILIKTGRDAVFFRPEGIFQLPQAYLAIAAAAMLGAMVHLGAIKRWGARASRQGVLLLGAVTLALFAVLVRSQQPLLLMVFFAYVPAAFAAIFASVWLLAGDLLEGAQNQVKSRIYSRIGAGSMVGGIVGGLIARGLSDWVHPTWLVIIGAALLLLVAAIVWRAHQALGEAEPQAVGPDQGAGVAAADFPAWWRQPYLIGLYGISGLGALAALFIDFQFYAAAVISQNNNAGFFAGFYIFLNSVSLLLQLTLAPRLQARLGLGGALLLLPAALLGAAGAAALWATVQGRGLMKVTEGGVKAAIHRALWEQVYLPIDQRRRALAKVAADGMAVRLSEGLGAAGLFLWLSTHPPVPEALDLTGLTWVTAAVICLWLGATHYLRTLGCDSDETAEPAIRLPDS